MAQLQRIAIAPSQWHNQRLTLTAEQHHYLCRVLRLHPGDRFIAMDGQGHWWLAELGERPLEAQMVEAIAIQNEVPASVILLIAMPKGSGMDEVVRQVTEVGVTDIVPILSDRTLLQPNPQKLDRWRRIIQEAAEQSERQMIPRLLPPMAWVAALEQWNQAHSLCYLCEARGNHPHLLTALQGASSAPVVIAIGPEGGWTPDELQIAIAAGYQPVSLGRRILKTVTAPLVAVSLIVSVLETMSESSPIV